MFSVHHVFLDFTPLESLLFLVIFIQLLLGFVESVIIWRFKKVSTNTIIFTLTTALVCLCQFMWELYAPQMGKMQFYFLYLFAMVINGFHVFNCLIRTKHIHIAWLCAIFLILVYILFYAIHENFIIIGNKMEFVHVFLFLTTLINNFVPLDSLLKMFGRNCYGSSHWIPLSLGMSQSILVALHRMLSRDHLLVFADLFGIVVYLFGFIIEGYQKFVYEDKCVKNAKYD